MWIGIKIIWNTKICLIHYLIAKPLELLLEMTKICEFKAGSWFLFIDDLLGTLCKVSDLFLWVTIWIWWFKFNMFTLELFILFPFYFIYIYFFGWGLEFDAMLFFFYLCFRNSYFISDLIYSNILYWLSSKISPDKSLVPWEWLKIPFTKELLLIKFLFAICAFVWIISKTPFVID